MLVLPRQVALFPSQLGSVLSRQTSQAPPASSRNPPQREENTLEDPKLKWVINVSSKPLTQAQRSLLAKGPNYVATPRHPPNLEYITGIESLCTKLGQEEVEELRADINSSKVLSPPKPNLNKAEAQVLRNFKGIGKFLQPIRQDYINKSNKLFNSTSLQGNPQGPH